MWGGLQRRSTAPFGRRAAALVSAACLLALAAIGLVAPVAVGADTGSTCAVPLNLLGQCPLAVSTSSASPSPSGSSGGSLSVGLCIPMVTCPTPTPSPSSTPQVCVVDCSVASVGDPGCTASLLQNCVVPGTTTSPSPCTGCSGGGQRGGLAPGALVGSLSGPGTGSGTGAPGGALDGSLPPSGTGGSTSVRAPTLDSSAIPVAQVITPVSGFSFGHALILWPLLAVFDLAAVVALVLVARRRWSAPADA